MGAREGLGGGTSCDWDVVGLRVLSELLGVGETLKGVVIKQMCELLFKLGRECLWQ